MAQSVPGADFPSRRRDMFTPQSESPTVHIAKPLSVLPLTKMEIKNRIIVFPKTRPGHSSGNIAYFVNSMSVVSCVPSLVMVLHVWELECVDFVFVLLV